MERLKKIADWIRTFPDWEPDTRLRLDLLPEKIGEAGIFSEGIRKERENEDVLGNRTAEYIWKIRIIWIGARWAEEEKNACRLMQMERWVEQQSRDGLIPVLGDIPWAERGFTRDGHLQSCRHPGTAQYEITVFFKYLRQYEVKK